MFPFHSALLKGNLTLSFRAAKGRGIGFALVCFQMVSPLIVFAQSQTKASSPTFASLSQRAAEARDADRLQEAISLYKRALALRPTWTEGWWSLGTLLYDQDNFREASKAFRKVVQWNPKNGTAHAMLGLCEFELGTDDAALRE